MEHSTEKLYFLLPNICYRDGKHGTNFGQHDTAHIPIGLKLAIITLRFRALLVILELLLSMCSFTHLLVGLATITKSLELQLYGENTI